MNRRALLAGSVFAVVLSHSALAQTRGPAPGAADQPGEAETKHMQETMRAGSLSLVQSRLAQDKAQDAKVKQFAKFEVDEQTGIAEVLKSMQGANATTGQGAANAEAQGQLDDKGKQMLKRLQDAKGADFDAAYLKAQLDGHQELLKIQEAYIGSGKVREHVNVAKLARGHIKEHIAMLQDLQKAKRG
jgi:putative membrane protein